TPACDERCHGSGAWPPHPSPDRPRSASIPAAYTVPRDDGATLGQALSRRRAGLAPPLSGRLPLLDAGGLGPTPPRGARHRVLRPPPLLPSASRGSRARERCPGPLGGEAGRPGRADPAKLSRVRDRLLCHAPPRGHRGGDQPPLHRARATAPAAG